MTQPNSGGNTPKAEGPEMASPVQWTRSGMAGRITASGGERDAAQLTAVITRSRRHSSPSNSSRSSEQLPPSSALAPESQEQAQHLTLRNLPRRRGTFHDDSSRCVIRARDRIRELPSPSSSGVNVWPSWVWGLSVVGSGPSAEESRSVLDVVVSPGHGSRKWASY